VLPAALGQAVSLVELHQTYVLQEDKIAVADTVAMKSKPPNNISIQNILN